MIHRVGLVTFRRIAPILACAAVAAIPTALVAWAVWPGFMSFDSLYAYRESIDGIVTAALPPIQVYGFMVARAVGIGVGGAFVVQTFTLFFACALFLAETTRNKREFAAASIAFAGLFCAFPSMLGASLVHWKDIPTASFCVLGFALWIRAARVGSAPLSYVAVAIMSLVVANRTNGITLVLVPLLFFFWRPVGVPTAIWRRNVAAIVVGFFVFAAAMSTWRLPDFRPLPTDKGLSLIMAWDLIGISACEGMNFLPPELAHSMPGADMRRLYDPRSFDLALLPHPGIPQIERFDLGTPESAKIVRLWRAAVPAHLGCYFLHRNAVFEELVGLDRGPLWYPTNGALEANSFGLRLEHVSAASAVTAFVNEGASDIKRRPFELYVLAALMLVLAYRARLRDRSVLAVAFAAGMTYLAGFYLTAPAADGRYLFATNVLCSSISSAVLTQLLTTAVRLHARGAE